jgi:choline dehydrogenase-like flavoprotein
MAIVRSPKVYDAIVVGSGAAGGMTAYVLTQAGAKVLMLEAGVNWDTPKDSYMFQWPYQAPLRAAGTPQKPFGYFDASIGGWTVEGEPYTTAPGEEFLWWRSRMLGGRTNHWGRISLRMGEYDFKPKSRDGLGFDWPMTYQDVAPYYDKVEELIGVFGSKEGMENTPDGVFMPPPPPRCYELYIKKTTDKLGIPLIPSRLSIITKNHNGRPACHYCGQCGRSCATGSNFSSPTVLLPPALKTGNLEIRTDAMVREVTVDDTGKATGVVYVNRLNRDHVEAKGKIVVLAASGCETTRILLNSKSRRFPNGLANSSGVVGKSLMDTVGVSVSGFVPSMMDLPHHNEDGIGGMHLYAPWWNYQKKMPFPRGYHIELGGGHTSPPGVGIFRGAHRLIGGGYGADLKQRYRKLYGSSVYFAGRGEMIPNDDCWCEIDPDVVDQWGIPVLRFHWKWAEAELLQAKHMQETFREIIETMGGQVLGPRQIPSDYGIKKGGEIIHEVGSARMGDDPKTSACNQFCQTWDHKNLFLTDGASFASNADKNPTLSIMAIAWRATEYMAAEAKKGNL